MSYVFIVCTVDVMVGGLFGTVASITNRKKAFHINILKIRLTKNLIPDPLIRDDQALVVNISDKGLVILTGCGHAGIINTINYANKITGIDRIHAIIGGFHLSADDGIFEAAIEPTLKEFQKVQPGYLMPCHCTGWKATNRIIETMPEKFIQSSVGTTFQF